MGHSNGYISDPVSINDLSVLLGVASSDLGTLCTHQNINKWAVFKPIDVNKIGEITLDDRKNKHMGLLMKEMTNLEAVAGGTSKSLDAILSDCVEWSYVKPKGGSSSPYRISDFLDTRYASSHSHSNGYNHNAKPCDSDWKNRQVPFKNTSITINTQYDCKISVGETSTDWFGGANVDNMPLSFVADLSSDWRMAYAVYLPSPANQWCFVVGNVIGSSNSVAPDFSTNTYLTRRMAEMTSYPYSVFTAIPFLAQANKGTILSKNETYDNTVYKSVSLANAKLYCMPSGQKSITISVNKPLVNKRDADGDLVIDNGGQSFVIDFPNYQSSPEYLVKGYEDSTGRTTCGWVVTKITASVNSGTSGGDQITRFVILFATIPETGKWKYDVAPTSAQKITISGSFSYTQNGSAKTVEISNKTLSSSSVVTNIPSGSTSISFYGMTLTDALAEHVYKNMNITSLT